MDIPQEPVPQTPSVPAPVSAAPVPASHTNVWMVVAGVLALLLLVLGAAWAMTMPKVPVADGQLQIATTTPTAQTASVPGWRVYENKEIGIAFEYPQAWGEVSSRIEKGCQPDYVYFGTSTVEKFMAQMQQTGDPCNQIYLRFASSSVFLSTKSGLMLSGMYGRGAGWEDMQVLDQSAACAREGAQCSTNSHGVIVGDSTITLYDEDPITVYWVKTPHRYYQSIVLSSAFLPAEYQADFDRLIDSLRFIQ